MQTEEEQGGVLRTAGPPILQWCAAAGFLGPRLGLGLDSRRLESRETTGEALSAHTLNEPHAKSRPKKAEPATKYQ